MMAVMALLVACSSDNNEATGEGMVPINLTISPKAVSTRTATTDIQSAQLASGQTFYAYFTSANVVPQSTTFTANGSGATTPATQPYFKLSETSTDVRAYYPSSVTEGTTSFTVQADQTSDDNYRASDLMFASANITKVFPASTGALTFAHKMAKIKVCTTTRASSIKAITLKNVLPTVSFTASTGAIGTAEGSATDVSMYSHSGQTSNVECVALIPPQSFASGATLIEITTSVHSSSKLTYQLPAAITFASGLQYIFNVDLHEETITVSNTVTAWNEGETNTAEADMKRPTLPIEYVALHNMYNSTNMAVNDYASSCGHFNWATACSYFDKHVTINDYNGNALSGKYHLPTVQEWMTIIPPRFNTSNAANAAVDVDGANDARIIFDNEVTVRTGMGETLQWGKKLDNTWIMPSTKFYNEYATSASYNSTANGITKKIGYAIRLKERDVAGPSGYGYYTCAYRYTFTDKDPACNNSYSLRVKVRYLGAYSTTTLSDITNDAYWSETEAEYIEVILPACGFPHNSTTYAAPSSVVIDYPERAYYWSNTQPAYGDANCAFQAFFSNYAPNGDHWNNKAMGTSIRLFRDGYTDDPGIPLANSTVGMVVADNGLAYATKAIAEANNHTVVAVVGYKSGSNGYAVALVDATPQSYNSVTSNSTYRNTNCTLADNMRGDLPVAPSGTTWKVLTKENYSNMFYAMGSTKISNNLYLYDNNVNNLITAAGGTGFDNQYWSTSDTSDAKWGWTFMNTTSTALWGNGGGKTGVLKIRPVLVW